MTEHRRTTSKMLSTLIFIFMVSYTGFINRFHLCYNSIVTRVLSFESNMFERAKCDRNVHTKIFTFRCMSILLITVQIKISHRAHETLLFVFFSQYYVIDAKYPFSVNVTSSMFCSVFSFFYCIHFYDSNNKNTNKNVPFFCVFVLKKSLPHISNIRY